MVTFLPFFETFKFFWFFVIVAFVTAPPVTENLSILQLKTKAQEEEFKFPILSTVRLPFRKATTPLSNLSTIQVAVFPPEDLELLFWLNSKSPKFTLRLEFVKLSGNINLTLTSSKGKYKSLTGCSSNCIFKLQLLLVCVVEIDILNGNDNWEVSKGMNWTNVYLPCLVVQSKFFFLIISFLLFYFFILFILCWNRFINTKIQNCEWYIK